MSEQQGSWEPDPFGRHQYRWFDGQGWTENVSDDGVVSADAPDPGGAPPPGAAEPEPTPAEPAAEEPPAEPQPPSEPVAAAPPPATPSGWEATGSEPTTTMPPAGGAPPPGPGPEATGGGGGGGNKLPLAIGAVALVALVGAAVWFFFLGGDDDDGLTDAERAQLISEIDSEGITPEQQECVADSLVDSLGVDQIRELLAAGDDTEPTDAQFAAALAAFEECDVPFFGADDGGDTTEDTTATTEDTTETTEGTTETTEGTTDTTEAAGGAGAPVPDAFLDLFVEGVLQGTNLSEEQARCFAEGFFDIYEGGIEDLLADPEALAEPSPELAAGFFEIIDDCGIDPADLEGAGAGGFPGLGGVPGGTGTDEPSSYGDDPRLDALWDACEGGSGEACDELYWSTPVESQYEEFGATCGGRTDFLEQPCVDVLGP